MDPKTQRLFDEEESAQARAEKVAYAEEEARLNTIVRVKCPQCLVCGERAEVEMTTREYERWQAGAHVQNVFSRWSPDARELLISGTHPACWDSIMPDEDE